MFVAQKDFLVQRPVVTLNDITLTDAAARLVDKRPLITSSLMCKVKNNSKENASGIKRGLILQEIHSRLL